jgi:Domain of unknown function (DUF5666)
MTLQWLNNDRPWRTRSRWLAALLATLALAGCGGVDSGGTGATPQSFAIGPITGFGSVIVNGVRFDDTLASVTDDDGAPRSRDDLRLGMTTEVRGSAITTDASGANVSTASSISFGSDLLGRIDSIDLAGKRLVLLGQTVAIGMTTVFDNISVSGGLPALAVGDVIEVYALFDAASGRYNATRIERKGAVAAYRLRGIVSGLDTSAKTFNIGSARISYAGLAGALPPTLANGNFVRVRLQTTQVGGVWLITGFSDGAPRPRESDDVRLEGLISAFTSATRFSVNGVAVDASGISPPAGLALGVRVEVEGISRGGVLLASKLKIETSGGGDQEFELRGSITSVSPPTLSFVLRGVTVQYSLTAPPTDFRDGTAANLAVGVNVEARGMLSADGTRLVAARIDFE